jgi:hypothetical protein
MHQPSDILYPIIWNSCSLHICRYLRHYIFVPSFHLIRRSSRPNCFHSLVWEWNLWFQTRFSNSRLFNALLQNSLSHCWSSNFHFSISLVPRQRSELSIHIISIAPLSPSVNLWCFGPLPPSCARNLNIFEFDFPMRRSVIVCRLRGLPGADVPEGLCNFSIVPDKSSQYGYGVHWAIDCRRGNGWTVTGSWIRIMIHWIRVGTDRQMYEQIQSKKEIRRCGHFCVSLALSSILW